MIIQRINKWLSVKARPKNVQPTLLILHATAGASAKSSIDYLRSKGNAYHYIIARDSKDSDWTYKSDDSECVAFHCVPHENYARHVSTTIPVPGTGGGHINDHSIAISLANLQSHVPKDPAPGDEEYTPQQLLALNELLALLKEEVPSLKFLTTHAVVQPWSRSDPLRIDGPALAEKFGYTWWEPTKTEIKNHKPKPKPKPAG
ncbi:MAG TPA: N-acetylmuramoyl-L-alanine amidase [Prosthecobacter sp.]|nr:N-acetylmuramoyl-L-alanine amidase [Prosthecobacter sp.]